MKEAAASVFSRFVGASKYTNQGQRVVGGQRLMQASSDSGGAIKLAPDGTTATPSSKPPWSANPHLT